VAALKPPSKLAWDNILTLPYYQAGKPVEELEREFGITNIIKLASNENPLGPSPKAIEAMKASVGTMHRYPDANGFALKRRLAEWLDLDSSLIGLGNGSDEILGMLCAAFIHPGDEAIIAVPTFIRYEICVQMVGGTPVKVAMKDWTNDLEAMAARVTDKTKLVFICNPNNPTGTAVWQNELTNLVERLPEHVIIVFDEAYREYVADSRYADTIDFLRQGRRVIILRTFSKAYGLAGLRIGYGLATAELASVLKLVRSPFNSSAMAQAAACAAIDDSEHIEQSRRVTAEGKKVICERFDHMELPYVESHTNFIFFDSRRNGMELFEHLLRRGVIIRPLKIGESKQYLRVTVGTMEENLRFLKELESVLEEVPITY